LSENLRARKNERSGGQDRNENAPLTRNLWEERHMHLGLLLIDRSITKRSKKSAVSGSFERATIPAF
jgi:hypothetical protein